MNRLLLIMASFVFLACTTHPHSDGRDQYLETIDNYSAGDKKFSGFYENFEFRATILNETVTRSIYNRMKQIYAWSDSEYQEKLGEQLSDLQSSSKIWLSFFTPERKDDNLANKVSIWKIYLQTPSQRYEGRAEKVNKNFSEAQALIPYHSRWATPYYVTFPVPSSEISGQDLRLIITGPLGHREVRFPKTQ